MLDESRERFHKQKFTKRNIKNAAEARALLRKKEIQEYVDKRNKKLFEKQNQKIIETNI